MLFVRHVNMTIGGVHGSLKLFFYIWNKSIQVFGFFKWNAPLISPFFARPIGHSYGSLYPFKGEREGGEALCHITYVQFPVCSNSLRGRKDEGVTERGVSEPRVDRRLAALYIATSTFLLLHYTHFHIGTCVWLRNAYARAAAFHDWGILVSSRRVT